MATGQRRPRRSRAAAEELPASEMATRTHRIASADRLATGPAATSRRHPLTCSWTIGDRYPTLSGRQDTEQAHTAVWALVRSRTAHITLTAASTSGDCSALRCLLGCPQDARLR
eukprot:2914525-Prymnesium_polylepis.1